MGQENLARSAEIGETSAVRPFAPSDLVVVSSHRVSEWSQFVESVRLMAIPTPNPPYQVRVQ